jgi:hypothetical protein
MTDDNDSLLGGLTDDSSRRSFMKQGALTGVGFALGAAGSGSALGQEDDDTDTGTGGGQAGGAQAFMLLNQVVPGAQFTVDSGELDWSPMGDGQSDVATHVVQYEFSASEYAFVFVPSDVDAAEGDQFTIDSVDNVTQSLGGMQDGMDDGLGGDNETDDLGGDNETDGLGGDNETDGMGGNETSGQMEPGMGQMGQAYFVSVQLSGGDGGAIGDDTDGFGDENETDDIGDNETGPGSDAQEGTTEDTELGEDDETDDDGGLFGDDNETDGNATGNDTGGLGGENDTGGIGGNNTTDNDTGL